MIFADIPAGIHLFIDASSFIPHFSAHPRLGSLSHDLLQRVFRGEIDGLTSTHVLSEVAHRLMTIEAMKVFNWPFQGIAQRLRKHPADVQKLTQFRQAIDEIPNFGVQVLSISPHLIGKAAAISQQTGLLANDALIVALMQNLALTHLASDDPDFDRVSGLVRYEAG